MLPVARGGTKSLLYKSQVSLQTRQSSPNSCPESFSFSFKSFESILAVSLWSVMLSSTDLNLLLYWLNVGWQVDFCKTDPIVPGAVFTAVGTH